MHAWECPCGTRNAPTFQQCRNCRRPAAQGRPIGAARPSAPPPPPRPAPPPPQYPAPPQYQQYQPPSYHPPQPPPKQDGWGMSPRGMAWLGLLWLAVFGLGLLRGEFGLLELVSLVVG